MKYIKESRQGWLFKKETITREEAISYLGEKRLDELINDNQTAKSMGCGILQEVDEKQKLWVGIQW